MAMFHISLLDVIQEADWCWLPAAALFGCSAGCVVNPESPVSKGLITQDSAGFLELLMGLLGLVSTALLEHKLADTELFVHSIATTSKEPDGDWLVLGRLPDCIPHITIIDVDLSRLWEVEIFGPSMTIVDNELNMVVFFLVFVTVVDVFTSSILQDDHVLKDPHQICNVLNRSPRFMELLLLLCVFWYHVEVSPCPLKVPSKCSTTI